MQGCDHAKVGGAIIALYFFAVMVPVEQNDRRLLPASEARIDTMRLAFYSILKFCVLGYVAATGRSDLDEAELSLISRMSFQERFHGEEAFDDALGVVQAVYTDSKEGAIKPQFCEEFLALFCCRVPFRSNSPCTRSTLMGNGRTADQ